MRMTGVFWFLLFIVANVIHTLVFWANKKKLGAFIRSGFDIGFTPATFASEPVFEKLRMQRKGMNGFLFLIFIIVEANPPYVF